jgi:hypothetical protein
VTKARVIGVRAAALETISNCAPTANKTFLIIVLLSGAPGATLAFFFCRLSPKIYFNYIKVNLAAQMTAGCAKRE